MSAPGSTEKNSSPSGKRLRHPVLDKLGGPIAFHREFVTLTGSTDAALMLSQALYWTQRTKGSGPWFWKTQAEWEEEAGRGRLQGEAARGRLLKMSFWQERRGQLARMYFWVDLDALDTALAEGLTVVSPKEAQKRERDKASAAHMHAVMAA